jgi:putative endonuclease
MPTDSRKSLGRLGEQLAADHFERLGWRIVERNYQTSLGELDLVAADGDTLVFAEVKTCRLGRGQPWDSLHPRKQGQVRKIAGQWFSERRGPFFERVRFDAIGVLVDDRDALVRLDHLEDAF